MAVSVDTGDLRIGAVLASPVCDAGGTKLISAGVEITAPFLERLRSRGISSVCISAGDLPRLRESQKGSARDTDSPIRSKVAHGAVT